MPVYLALTSETRRVKIGFTAGAMRVRLAKMQTDNHERLTVIRWLEGNEETESLLHARYAHVRLRGDWFTFCETMLGDLGIADIPPPAVPEPVAVGPTPELPTPSQIEARAELAGLTIPEVCRKAEIAPSTFWRWKMGKTSPTLGMCQRLLDATEAQKAAV